jgi:LPPG:FO 2-phospho-L-lactate transferase
MPLNQQQATPRSVQFPTSLDLSLVALAGGVGGAKLAYGLYRLLDRQLTVVVNTGDDFEHWGLKISPDLDTVLYNLAGINDQAQGWGLAGESYQALEQARQYGAEGWFRLGDRDLATHILRTRWLREGLTLTEVTFKLCQGLGVAASIVPMSDDPVPTMVHTDEGVLPFQDYFVRRRCEPRLLSLAFQGQAAARPALAALAALDRAHAVVLCPSNPYLSLDPILLLPGLAERLRVLPAPVIAVSPIVGGQALKGPAAKIMAELGVEASPVSVARHLASRIRLDGFVMDATDAEQADAVAGLGVRVLVTDTIMGDAESKIRLAQEVLSLIRTMRP